jgi:hypothetical protein
MRFHRGSKDGGPESHVQMWGFESKRFGSVLLLRFADGSRDAYHTHAFNAVSWVLRGRLWEWLLVPHHAVGRSYTPALCPVVTAKTTLHKVESLGTTWVLSVRGPWDDEWMEYIPATESVVDLTHGRIEL